MPREARKESGTGIYHVMLRGINRQDIFEEFAGRSESAYAECAGAGDGDAHT
jgi:hypothetical protein